MLTKVLEYFRNSDNKPQFFSKNASWVFFLVLFLATIVPPVAGLLMVQFAMVSGHAVQNALVIYGCLAALGFLVIFMMLEWAMPTWKQRLIVDVDELLSSTDAGMVYLTLLTIQRKRDEEREKAQRLDADIETRRLTWKTMSFSRKVGLVLMWALCVFIIVMAWYPIIFKPVHGPISGASPALNALRDPSLDLPVGAIMTVVGLASAWMGWHVMTHKYVDKKKEAVQSFLREIGG